MERLNIFKHIPRINNHGFTLIELMVAIVISAMVSAGIYTIFINQNKSYLVQEQIVEMQQTLRSVFLMMERDIRMAGYDREQSGKFEIDAAAYNSFEFKIDRNDDGVLDSDEDFKYELYDSNDLDTESNELHRMSGGSALAYHIDRLAFAYAYDSDGDGDIEKSGGEVIWAIPTTGISGEKWYNLDSDNDGDIDINDTEGGVDTGTVFDKDDIRAVKAWVLVRSSRTDNSYDDSHTYVVGSVHYAPNDHYRRKLGITTIQLRNVGL